MRYSSLESVVCRWPHNEVRNSLVKAMNLNQRCKQGCLGGCWTKSKGCSLIHKTSHLQLAGSIPPTDWTRGCLRWSCTHHTGPRFKEDATIQRGRRTCALQAKWMGQVVRPERVSTPHETRDILPRFWVGVSVCSLGCRVASVKGLKGLLRQICFG